MALLRPSTQLSMVTSSERIVEIATASAWAVVRRGWTRHTMVDEKGQVCVQGAIKCGVGIEPVQSKRYPEFYGFPPLTVNQMVEYRDVRWCFSQAVGMPSVSFNDAFAADSIAIIDGFQKVAERFEDQLTKGVTVSFTPIRLKTQADHELAGGPSS